MVPLVQTLEQHGVRYALTGSLAITHEVGWAVSDMDLVAVLTPLLDVDCLSRWPRFVACHLSYHTPYSAYRS
jgi:hypothetical protein